MAKTIKIKRGRPPVKRVPALAMLVEQGSTATVAELGVTPGFMQMLVKGGFVKPTKQTVKGEGRGRPAVKYTLTLKGRAEAKKYVASEVVA